jgi:hypothetical protein
MDVVNKTIIAPPVLIKFYLAKLVAWKEHIRHECCPHSTNANNFKVVYQNAISNT